MLDRENAQKKSDLLLQTVRQLTAELHGGRAYSLDVTLDSALDRDLGLDSLARVELLSRMERTFAVKLPERALAHSQSPRDLLRAVVEAEQGEASSAAFMEKISAGAQTTSEASEARTLLDVLEWHTRKHPDQLHINLYQEGALQERITFGSLNEEAEAVAAALQERGVEPSQKIAIMLPTGREYFVSFFGALLAGAVPVPLYPPARPQQVEEHLRRHREILKNSLSCILITIAEVLPLARLLKAHVETLQNVVTAEELSAQGGQLTPQPINPEATAFLQYTSGSTGTPKGVVLSHANLLANIRAMGNSIQATSADVFVSWLPLYHDMGLIGAWLGSLYYGCQLVIMSPLSFMMHPESWLWAIHRHRGTLSASPNFGYEFCLKKIDEKDLEGLDLRSWRLAFNGAEPISAATISRFSKRFSHYGFKKEAMTPVYGLAESTVGLAFSQATKLPVIDRVQRKPFMHRGHAMPASDDDPNCLHFVCCGRPLHDHQIRIVDKNGQDLPERMEGCLQFKGVSATSGYFRNNQKTKELFHGDWLDSGDLAYMADGDVYITSRTKDIIIRSGRNIYPYEIEEEIGRISGIRKGCCVAFGSLDPQSKTERLVVIAETREAKPETLQHLHASINSTVTDLIGMPPDEVILAPPASVLKTSSGKLRRAATRKLYEQNRLGTRSRAVWWQIVRMAASGIIPQLRRLVNSTTARCYAGYAWCLFTLLAVPVWLMVMLLPRQNLRWGVLHRASRLLIRLSGNSLEVRGLDNPPQNRSVIMVANHASYLDSFFLIAALPRPVIFVAKAELKKKAALRWFLTRIEVEFIDRYDVDQGAKDAKHLSQKGKMGKSMLFFPEGTFHRIPGLLPFRMGAFLAATESQSPIVPITIRGTRHLLPSGSWLPRRAAVTVTISPPLETGKSNWAAAVSLRDRARKEILRHCREVDLSGTRPPVREKPVST